MEERWSSRPGNDGERRHGINPNVGTGKSSSLDVGANQADEGSYPTRVKKRKYRAGSFEGTDKESTGTLGEAKRTKSVGSGEFVSECLWLAVVRFFF